MTSSSVLVTGMTGHIGGALTATLRTAGFSVSGAGRSKSLPERFGHGIEYVEVGALGAETDWSKPLRNAEAVVHLAGIAHVVRKGNNDLLSTYRRVNTLATERLAIQAARAGVRRFVFVSSVLIHGHHSQSSPFQESDRPAPSDPYARSKWEAEKSLVRIARETELELVIVRPPLVYGPGAKGNFLRLMRIVDRGTPLPLASIRNRRSLVGLTNLCDLLRHCLERSEAAGQTFLAADETLPTPALVHRIADALGRPARLWPCPPELLRLGGRLTGQRSAVARLTESLEIDSGKARRLLDWSPSVSMGEELMAAAAWWRGLQP